MILSSPSLCSLSTYCLCSLISIVFFTNKLNLQWSPFLLLHQWLQQLFFPKVLLHTFVLIIIIFILDFVISYISNHQQNITWLHNAVLVFHRLGIASYCLPFSHRDVKLMDEEYVISLLIIVPLDCMMCNFLKCWKLQVTVLFAAWNFW